MTVSNPGAVAQSNVVLSALVPPYFSAFYAGSQAVPAGTCTDGASFCTPGETVSWSLGTLAPGEVRVVRISDAVSTGANDGALLPVEAMVTADGVSAIQATHTVVVSELTPPLQVALAADRNPAAAGAQVSYRVRYSNLSGSVTADRLRVSLPVGMSFVSASDGGAAEGDVVSWPVAVGPGSNGARELVAQVGAGLDDGALLRAEARFADSAETASASAAHVVAVSAVSPLELAITSSVDPVEDGTALTLRMTVSNPGAVAQSDVLLSALVPPYFSSFYPDSQSLPPGACADAGAYCTPGETVSWSLGTLAPGEARVFEMSANVSTGANDGALLSGEAMVSASGTSAIQATHTVVVSELAPALQFSLSGPASAAAGEFVAYQLDFNNHSTTVTADTMSVSLPPGMSFVSAGDGASESNGVVTWPVSIEPGGSGIRAFSAQLDFGLGNGELLRLEGRFADSVSMATATAARITAVGAAPPFTGLSDFEAGAPGWMVDNGVWEIGVASAGPGACFSGDSCVGTVLGGDYPRGVNSRLISPEVTLPTLAAGEELLLRYRQWWSNQVNDDGHVQVQVYESGVWSEWTTLVTFTGYFRRGWHHARVELSAYAGKQVRLGFWHTDYNDSNQAAGWYIDDVQLVQQAVPQLSGVVGFESGLGDWYSDDGVWQAGTPLPAGAAIGGGTGRVL